MDRDAALAQLRAFVADCTALGKVPVTRAIRRHRSVFVDLRNAGLTWPAIADLLNEAGMKKGADTWRRLFDRTEEDTET